MSELEHLKKSGWNWWAFLFTWMWYLAKGLWARGLLIFVGQMVLGWGVGGIGLGVSIASLSSSSSLGMAIWPALIAWATTALIVGIYCGKNANTDYYISRKRLLKELES